MNISRNGILFAACLLLMPEAHAVTVTAVGEFMFTGSTTEDRACQAAEQRAKEEAVRKVRGESVSADEQFSCKERSGVVDNEQCVLNRFAWNRLDGQLRRPKILNRFVLDIVNAPGVRKCWIQLEVDVVAKSTGEDPNFDYRIDLSQSIFKPGEKLSIRVTTPTKVYLSIFNWIPADKRYAVTKIFPSALDTNNLIEKTRVIPDQASSSYEFELTLPKGLEGDFSDEYLLFVGTKSPVRWLDEYSIDDLNERLLELDQKSKRIRRMAYRVVKPI